MLRFVFFGALGMLAAAGLLIASGHASIAGWVGGVGSVLVIATSVLLIHVFATRHEVRASEPQIRSAIAAGRAALVRIDAISETGVIINERHVCALTLTVQPRGGHAFRTIISRRISALEMPQFQPGTTHPAVVLTPDGPETVIVTEPDLLRELKPWLTNIQVPPAESVGDIQRIPVGVVRADGTRRAPFVGHGRKGRAVRVVAYVVAFLLGLTIPLALTPRTFGYVAHAISHGRLVNSPWDGEFVEKQLADLSKEIGHDRVAEVRLWENSISVDAYASATPAAKERVNDWDATGAVFVREGRADTSFRGSFQLSQVSWRALDPLLRDVRARIADSAMEVVSVHINQGESGPHFLIYAHGIDGTVTFRADADGSNLTHVSGELP